MQNETINLIQQVNEFYDSAWNKLILTGGIALSIIGVLVPIIIQWWQKKYLTLEKENIKNEIEKKMDEKYIELINTKFSEMDELNNKNIFKLKGISFHLQGNSSLAENDLTGALDDYYYAADLYCKGEDHQNLITVLNNIIKIIEDVSKESFEELIETREINLNEFFNNIKKIDNKNTIKPYIQDLKLGIKRLKTKKVLDTSKK